MKTRLRHGTEIETATPAEVEALLEARLSRTPRQRIRTVVVVQLDAAGVGQDEVYAVPLGMEFEVRRVFLDLDSASAPLAGNVPLNAGGAFVEYLRSGSRIEYAQPMYGSLIQVPGSQTWGAEQGPYLRNGEVFEARTRALTANARFTVIMEGILLGKVERR